MIEKSKRSLKKTKNRAHKKAKFLLRHPFILPVTVFFVVVFVGLVLTVSLGATAGSPKDAHIVDVYVDEEKRTVTTRARTVADLLDRIDVQLIDEDIVEPARDAPIIEDNTQINIYRARPISIVDGDRVITVLSAHTAPRLVVAEAGIDVFKEDIVEFSRSEADLLDISSSEQVVIDRSIELQLNVYGAIRTLRTTADSVQELLDANGIELSGTENIQPALDTSIEPGLLVSVNREGITTVAETEVIGYQVESRSDASLTVGESRVERVGVNGEEAVIYEVTEIDGVEQSREYLQRIVTKEPVSEIRLVGTKPATLSSSVNVSADKIALMAAAGIAESDYAYVDFIVTKESNWRPGALNSSSGAYGLCQSLPASKMASAGSDYLTNPVTQLRWCSSYSARYGGWQGSYNAWLVQRWW